MAFFPPVYYPTVPERFDDPSWLPGQSSVDEDAALRTLEATANPTLSERDEFAAWAPPPIGFHRGAAGAPTADGDEEEDDEPEEDEFESDQADEADDLDPEEFVEDHSVAGDVASALAAASLLTTTTSPTPAPSINL